MQKLKLEVFESDKPIEPISYCVYTIIPKEQISSIQEFMRSAAGKISYRSNTHAFTDDKKIFTLEKITDFNIDDSFKITFEKFEKVSEYSAGYYFDNRTEEGTVTFRAVVEYQGQTETMTVDESIMKIDGKWYIVDSF